MNTMSAAARRSYDDKLNRMGVKINTASMGEEVGEGHTGPKYDGTLGEASGDRASGYEVSGKAAKPRLDRKPYANGGPVKKKGGTTVNVIVAPQGAGGGPPPPMPPPPMMAPPPPPPPPPMPPPHMGGAGGPAGGPPPGLGGPPPGLPMGRANGGRVARANGGRAKYADAGTVRPQFMRKTRSLAPLPVDTDAVGPIRAPSRAGIAADVAGPGRAEPLGVRERAVTPLKGPIASTPARSTLRAGLETPPIAPVGAARAAAREAARLRAARTAGPALAGLGGGASRAAAGLGRGLPRLPAAVAAAADEATRPFKGGGRAKRADGGRTYQGGAGGAKGRLEKIEEYGDKAKP